jgi:DeoR/GlpR family transcriptional regulator of sugar metabolism
LLINSSNIACQRSRDVSEAHIKRAVIEHVRRVILDIKSNKFGGSDFAQVCGLDRVDTVITDSATEGIRAWRQQNQTSLEIEDPQLTPSTRGLRVLGCNES